MSVHNVKSWTYLFDALLNGNKHHDIRVMDRDYKVGDLMLMQEYDWGAKQYTGRETVRQISYITSAKHEACAFSHAVLHPEFCVLSLERIKP